MGDTSRRGPLPGATRKGANGLAGKALQSATPVKPVRIDPAFDDPAAVVSLCRRSAPYRLAAVVHESGASGADVPWFRTYWARLGELTEPAAAAMLHNERFIEMAKAVFSARIVVPVSMMINLNAPMAAGAPHIDLPRFRVGEGFPPDLLMAMSASGLFRDWIVPTASTISWFYRGAGGDFDYWPDGPRSPRRTLATPLWNVGLLGDNERMVHQMGAVGRPADRMAPGALSREARLDADKDGSGWTLSDGDDRRRFCEDDIRISILWKAYAFGSEGELALFHNHRHDLSLPEALTILDRDLRRRGLPRLDLNDGYDGAARLQIHTAYASPPLNTASAGCAGQ